MALFLSNEDVAELLPMSECIDVLDDLFRQESQGLVENIARQRNRYGALSTTLMGGVALGSEAYAVRHASSTLLYSTVTGKLEAVLEPGTLAWIRTGAASGVAAKYLAEPDASVVGMLGAGRQAVTQLQAMCEVRPIRHIKVFSRTPETRTAFAREMAEQLGVEVEPVDSARGAVQGSPIVVAITNAREPVFDGDDLDPGTCVIAAGSNSWMKREVDVTTIRRSDLVVVDNLEQAKTECGELMAAATTGAFRWRQAVELHQVVGGQVPGRPSAEAITLFESQGIGIEDVAASAYVLEKARAAEMGQELPF
ncbi:MAG: ornithine cyclodeaminase family protein [Gemmatimonadota bacterium]